MRVIISKNQILSRQVNMPEEAENAVYIVPK